MSRKAELQGNRKRKKPLRLDQDQELTSKRRTKAPVRAGSARNNSGVSHRSLSTTNMKPVSDSFDDDSWDMDNTAPDTGDVFQDDDNSRVISECIFLVVKLSFDNGAPVGTDAYYRSGSQSCSRYKVSRLVYIYGKYSAV